MFDAFSHELPRTEPRATQDERFKPVTMFARFNGAWNEYNTRIAARQSITQIWFAGVPLLLAVSYNTGNEMYLMSAFAVPVANVLHGALMWMHDAMMGRLHAYLIDCEKYMNTDSQMPSYHVDERYSQLGPRQWQNWTFVFIALGFSVAGYIPLLGYTQGRVLQPVHMHLIYWGVAIVAPVCHFLSIRGRKEAIRPRTDRMLNELVRIVEEIRQQIQQPKREVNEPPVSPLQPPNGPSAPAT